MHQFQSFAPQAPTVAEYAFPSVLQFLQSEWRRFERDRNEWDIEKAEMKARIAFLEGEKRGVDNTKMDLMKRVKMLEYALRQERSKYVEGNNAIAAASAIKGTASVETAHTKSSSNDHGSSDALSNSNSNSNASNSSPIANGASNVNVGGNGNGSGNSNGNMSNIKAQNRISTYSASGVSMTQVSPTSGTSLDPVGRAKSREFLRICLQEISYLTASVPQNIASAMPPTVAQNRLSRQDLEKRVPVGLNGMRGVGGGKNNRHSDFFPATAVAQAQAQAAAAAASGNGMGTGAGTAPVPPSLPRSNSVPIPTLQSLSKIKPTAGSPPLGDSMTGPLEDEGPGQTTLKQQNIFSQQQPQQQQPQRQQTAKLASPIKETSASALKPGRVTDGGDGAVEDGHEEEGRPPTGLEAFQREEAITVIHSPLSGEQWQAELQKAGRELSEAANGKKTSGEKTEDVAQLTKDVQDKFNISSEQLNKMVKGWDWDKSKQEVNPAKNSIRKKKTKDGVVDELASLGMSETEALENDGATKTGADGLVDEPARWRPKITLRRHLDTVRSIAFHPADKALLSGSEDGTMKYWNLEAPLRESKRPLHGEVEPVHTYRGHTKPITAVAISADQGKCFSASMDSTVRSWKLVPMNKETYARQDPALPMSSFIGHTDTVWDIKLFPLSVSSSQLLASISADGALKIWDTETKGSPLRSSWGYHGLEPSETTEPTEAYTSGLAKLPVPTGLDFCPTDLRKMVVSYSNAVIKLFDIETGKEILTFKSDETYDGTTATQINKIVCHPTMPIVISGHEDRYIRFFDINSGACSFSMLSHLDAVSSLDIEPSGLVLCSGGHDGSVRLWDIASSTRPCLQEFTGHRRKSDEGVTSVRYHPTVPGLLATAGADAIVKVYTRS